MSEFFTIPLEADAGYSFNVALENTQYTITIHWNVTEEAYYMDLATVDLSVDIKGIKLVTGINLLRQYPIDGLGGMFIADMSGEDSEPTFDSLGDTHVLWYVVSTNANASL